jgi:hypothetical protein
MEISLNLFLAGSIILLAIPFFLCLFKADFHWRYLKGIYPDELSKYESWLVAYNKFYNKYAFLILPYFNRESEKENTQELKELARKIRLFCNLIYIDILVTAIIVISVIILFGD